jgi:hypothetical protein
VKTYRLLLIGLSLAFLLLAGGAFVLLSPTKVGDNGKITAIPRRLKAGQLVSYTINQCEEGKFYGLASVNIQSNDNPPQITVAVASPSAQRVHCHNVILVPQPLPTGTYHLIIFIHYYINPLRNALNPVTRQYVSNTFHVSNQNPDFQLPQSKPKAPATTGGTASIFMTPANKPKLSQRKDIL